MFCARYKKRPGRALRIIPEWQDDDETAALLKRYKLKPKGEPYQSLSIDLTQNEETLKANLRKNWRNQLTKAQKSGVEYTLDTTGQYFQWLIKFYNFDKKTKGYDGPSVQLLEAMAKVYVPLGDMLILRAMHEGRAVAGIMIFCHGRGATYQVGWNTQEGRKTGAHNVLLWQAMLHLKTHGIQQFDLGGINDTKSQNLTTFKSGLGGHHIHTGRLYS